MNTRICRTCRQELPVAEFYTGRHYRPDGIATQCKPCYRAYRQLHKWGYTYEELIEKYGNHCGICFAEEERLAVDHDHKHCDEGCKECIRGLLCGNCNRRLEVVEDTVWVSWANEYLEQSKLHN